MILSNDYQLILELVSHEDCFYTRFLIVQQQQQWIRDNG